MTPEKVFTQISESNILDILATRDSLNFVGDKETIDFLKFSFSQKQKSSYKYFCWSEDKEKISEFCKEYQEKKVFITASITDENEIYEQLKIFCSSNGLRISLVKLFDDVYINSTLKKRLLESADKKIVPPQIAYAVVSTPRSGSNAVCEALASTKLAGLPREDLRYTSQFLSLKCNFDYIRFLKILMSHRVTDNNVFGTKFISHFLLHHEESKFNFNEIVNTFKFVYLIREDKLEQAVSAFLAQKTNVWHLNSQKNERQYKSLLEEVEVENKELSKIHKIHREMIEQEKGLKGLLDKYDISPLIVKYSDFVQNNSLVISRVLNYLGIDYNLKLNVKLSSKRLQSKLSENIIRRYKKKYQL